VPTRPLHADSEVEAGRPSKPSALMAARR
jgi:hypothetical protein